jgi:hypothetical protein
MTCHVAPGAIHRALPGSWRSCNKVAVVTWVCTRCGSVKKLRCEFVSGADDEHNRKLRRLVAWLNPRARQVRPRKLFDPTIR